MMHVNEMIEKIQQGKTEYVEQALESLKPLLLKSIGYCKRKEQYELEDLVQEGYVHLLELIQSPMEQVTAYLPYVQMKLKYFYMNYGRSHGPVTYLEDIGKEQGSWEELLGSSDKDCIFEEVYVEQRTLELAKILGELPELHWQIIDRFYFRGQKTKQIAKELQEDDNFIRRCKRKILKELKEKIYLSIKE